MPNYRKKNNNNNRNKNKNKNKNPSSSSIKQETRIVESTTTSTSTGIEPNLPADVRNSYISTTSAKTKIVVVNVDEASNSSSVSNEEIGNKFASSNIDIDTLSDLATPFSGSEDTNSILKQSSQFYSSSTSSSSSCSKKSTEIENQQLNRAVFDIGDSTLTDSVIKETIVRDNSSSGKNSLKTGSANSKDASAAASSTAALPPAATQSIETSRIDESVSEKVREVIESSKEDQSSKVIVHKVIVKNGSEKSVTTSSTEPSRVIVHQISKDDHDPQPQTIIHQKEESSSSSSHRASKNGVDLSKKTSTKAAESSTTQTLSFSNVRGQPTRQMIYEHPQRVMVDNFSRVPDPSRAIIHQISREGDPSKVIVHQISKEEKKSISSSLKETVVTQHTLPQTTGYTSIVHQITPITPISADFYDHTDHSIFQKSFAESTSSKKETKDTQTKQPSEHQKRVVLIPIVQENSTQTSPLPSYSDNPLHSSLLEVIKDENSHPPSSHRVEVPRQTSSSPLSRSPVICFENLSESFELNKEVSEETPKDNSVPQTSEKPSKKASDHLEPLRIPAFPIKRPQKIILHPIINEVSGKPVFPYSEKTLETIDTSSKEIASRILKEVSCELKSSFMSERTTKKTVEEEKTSYEPIRTSFPVSIKKQSSFRPGFFETDVFQKEVNPLDIEAKVIVHRIAKEETKCTDSKQKPTDLQGDQLEKKVTVHEISNDLHIEETRSEEESYQSRIKSMPSKPSPPDDLKTNKENIDQEQAKVIVHQISLEESAFESKETKKIIGENNNEPNVILHQIARSPSFPLTSETKGEIPMKSSIQPKGSFPLSALKIKHPDQYCASSEKKTINFEKLQKNKDQNIQAQKIIKHKIVQPGSEPTFSSFPLSGEKQKKTSFISQTIGKDKVHSASVGSSFPISTERESHESQYTSRPEEFQAKSIDLKSLRDSADLRQSSSTLTSTFGLPETEKRIEIIHQILQDPKSDLSKDTIDRSPNTFAKKSEDHVLTTIISTTSQKIPVGSSFPISTERETHESQYTSRPGQLQAKSIDLNSLRDSADLRQSSSTLTSTFGLPEAEKKIEIVHQILQEAPKSDFPQHIIDRSSSAPAEDHLVTTITSRKTKKSSDSYQKTSTIISNEVKVGANQSKEIIHPIVKEEKSSDPHPPTTPDPKQNSSLEKSSPNEITHKIIKETSSSDLQSKNLDHQTSQDESISSSEGSVLTVIHNESPRSISPPPAEEPKSKENSEEKVAKRPMDLPPLDLLNQTQSASPEQKQDHFESTKVLNHAIVRQIEKPLAYRVESPQPEKLPMIMKKSKSFDDDDIVIQEMSDTSSAGDTDNPPLISEAESSETDTLEAADDFSDTPGTSSLLSIETLPMDHENDSSSPKSSADYKSRRQQNRAALESHFLPQFLAPNFLDSIKEENSDLSDSDRRSSCSDRFDPPVQHTDLDDDVFHNPPKKANAVYPKSNLDFSKKHKHVLDVRPPKTSIIREETPPPSVVEAKIIDQGSIEESCSSWSTDCTPESEAAEVVYIDSASSSVSDLLELDYSQGQSDETDPIDVRIQTPTIDLDSVNEMFATCQTKENNDSKIHNPPTEKPPPSPPVNEHNIEQEKINEQNLLPSHNKNDLPDTGRAKLENEVRETRKNFDEIIFENKETVSEKPPASADTQKNSDDVSSAAGTLLRAADENSIPNNSNSCESAIEPIVTSNYTSSVCVSSFVTVVVGSDKKENMDNIREIVNASSKSELNKITDQPSDRECISKTSFIIGQLCSDHTLKSDTQSVTPTTTTNNNNNNTITTTTSTKILTLHDLSQALDNTKHLHNPLVSPCSTTALDRQESFDSHGSDQSHSTNQSQCTAINQGSLPHCDWNEFDTSTDTTYVSESDTGSALASSEESSNLTAKDTTADETESPKIQKLRLLCTEALASMPYGQEVLEELATVAKNIQEMPYPLPDLPQIQDIQLSLGSNPEKSSVITLSQVPPTKSTSLGQKLKSPPPPPVPEPPSKYDSDSWLGVPSESDPNVLVCLSPSQRNAVKNDSTADSLLDMHKKFVERRGYHEYTTKQVNAINQANSTSADAPPKLSKISSPPPPPLPPRPPTVALTNPNGNTDTNDINDDEEDQNNHRLLAIIRDTHESKQQNSSMMTSTTSENISRRTESGIHHHTETSQSKGLDKEFAKTPSSVLNKQSPDRESAKSRHSEKMQQSESEHAKQFVDGETVLGMRFPTSEYFDSIFDGKNKRFSNIETGSKPTEFCSQILATQPKRYSNIETSSFESKKYVENGKVLYDVSDSQKQKIVEGDQPDASVSSVGASVFPEISKPKSNGMNGGGFPLKTQSNSDRYASGDSENIMSVFKLNSTAVPPSKAQTKERTESSPPAPPVPPLPPTFAADTTATSSMATTTKKSTSTSESHINRTFNAKTSGEKTFDDFGQRAKEAASTNTPSTTTATANAFQHEKLFKEFDELSNLLKDELDSGKRRPPATLNNNDIPASVIDYNRVARESKIQHSHVSSTTSSETHRREQMKKLADEIDRTAKHKLQQRQEMRIPIAIEKPTESAPRSAPILQPRTYEIPVQVENGRGTPHPNYQQQRSYEVPVQVERQSSSRNSRQRTFSEHQSGREIPIQVEKATPDRFRRAESMFNISDSTSSRQHLHHDEWVKYVGDLGSSENICKPFQREVEICYLGRRPNIRAPRMSASTSDLSNIQTFDTHGAYDVRRTAQTPRPREPPRPVYLSTQSMIDTAPITPCVSSRRSPAPERRSSLPRELHDKQLQYITSKEQQLKYEFERLENERRQLIDEMNRVQMNQRLNREAYRQRQLPPLTEDESFRQQMAEEWLNKVAEREERRLQKIIKISKVNQEAGMPVVPPRRHSVADDIGDEFLRRVKERRSKLCMPSDSDWESGAESQPMPRTDGSRSETDEPPVTVFEGHSTANIKQLPKHLREFAKLTSQMKEEHREEITENTSSSASKMTSFKTTVKTSSNNHEQIQSPSQSTFKDGRYPYKANGYMSEPEPNYDSDYSTVKYRTLERRRLQSTGTGTESRISAAPTTTTTGNESQNETFYGTMPNPVKSGQGSYKVQPGRIENYITGHSSVSEKEKKEQLEQQKLSPHYTEGNLSRALLKEQGYTSDSNLVFRKKDVPILQSPLSPVEQKQVYKSVQAGGQPPLFGFRKPAPEKPKESPNRYFESDVNIHYKTPIRYEYKDPIPEEELAIRQAETMQKLYQEERRRKYLQELQDMSSRRHTDNFTPSQKSPIPLNRYDDFNTDLAPKSPNTSNYPRTVARALYNFQGQTARELTFKKGDVIYIRRQIDKNWYEGEHNAMIGLLPSNYVELLAKDGIRQPPKKPSEGQARAKYNFQAQSGIELSLNKGEHVTLTRRVDENWYEGKIANRKGIFPVSYVEVLVDIGADDKTGRLPATQSIITQSSSSAMRPSLDTLRTNINNEFNSLTSNGQPPNGILRETRTLHKTEVLHVDTNTEPVAYRALYKYRPQNTDELELQEGDIVFVLEKCDDGWFVGTSQRSGCFGTFPGNYVERV